MAVVKVWDSFDSGIYLLGGREATPPNAVRVGTGFNPVHGHSMRSRNANTRLSTQPSISVITFVPFTTPLNAYHYSVDNSGNLQRNFVVIKSGLTVGQRLSFAKGVPQIGASAYLFGIGAGIAIKIDESGNITNWGILAPADGMVAHDTELDGINSIGKAGAFGMLGNYSYYYTFKNSTTGTHGEPNPTTVTVTGASGAAIKLSSLPTTSSDPQVDTVTIWRTIGNGGLYYNVVDIPLANLVASTGVYYDCAGDYPGFGTSLAAATGWVSGNYNANNGIILKPTHNNPGNYYFLDITSGNQATGVAEPTWPQTIGATVVDNAITWQNIGKTGLLGITQLVLGLNTLPPLTATACAFYNGTMFICGDQATGHKGRIYFSAAALGAEGVAGYVDISNDDDPTVGFGTYAGQIYCFTKGHIWLINNISFGPLQPAFSGTQLGQAPGCISLQSIQETPIGIVYQTAEHDLHVFNGYLSANLVSQLLPLLSGDTVEGYPAIGLIVAATYGRDEYWFSDGVGNLFVVNIMPQSLPSDVQTIPRVTRCHGTAATALYYMPETGEMCCGWNGGTYHIEDTSKYTADDGTGTLPFNLRTSSFYSGDKYTAKGMRLLVDVNDGRNMISVYASVDGTDYLLGTTDGAGVRKKYEFPFNISGSVIGVYLTSTGGNGQIEVFRFAIDADVSGTSDTGTKRDLAFNPPTQGG